MKFLLSQIKNSASIGPFIIDDDVDVSNIAKLENNDIRAINSVHVDGNCVVDGEELIFTLTISGEMVLPCARTLVDVPYSFEANTVEVFSESRYFGKEEEEEEIFPIIGETIDLTTCIEENILLAIPYRVFSTDEKVLEQALLKGEGWELSFEDEQVEQEKPIDPRLKKLQSLLDNKEKDI